MTSALFFALALAVTSAFPFWLMRHDYRDGYRVGYWEASHGMDNAYADSDSTRPTRGRPRHARRGRQDAARTS